MSTTDETIIMTPTHALKGGDVVRTKAGDLPVFDTNPLGNGRFEVRLDTGDGVACGQQDADHEWQRVTR